MKPLEPMPKSAAPPASNCGTFTSGPPCADGDVQAALGVKPFRQRLVKAAMLGLRLPVGDESDVGAAARPQPAAGSGEGQKQKRGDEFLIAAL